MSLFGKSYGQEISGKLKIDGKERDLKNSREAIEAGLAYVTEDRKGNGLVLGKSIRENTTMARMSKICSRGGVINLDEELKAAEDYKEKMSTKCPSVEQLVGNLSGGNQQKVLLSKWMFAEPDILILDEPTRGIDVGAKYEIYCIMNQMIEEGKSVIMEDAEKTCLFIEKMAEFFRYNVQQMKEDTTLFEELGAVDNYLYILNVRFTGDIHYEKKVDPDVPNVHIPSMILQPIVENAVNHGIQNIEREGEIYLSVTKIEDELQIIIRDNGIGMSHALGGVL